MEGEKGQAWNEEGWKISTNKARERGPILCFSRSPTLPELSLRRLVGSHRLHPPCKPGLQAGSEAGSIWKAGVSASETLSPSRPPAEVQAAQERGCLPLHLKKIDAVKTEPKPHATNQGTPPPQKQILASPAFVVPIFSSCSFSLGDFPGSSLLPECMFLRSHVAPENSGGKMKKWMCWVIHSLPHFWPQRHCEPGQKTQVESAISEAHSERHCQRAHASCCVCFLSSQDRVGCCATEMPRPGEWCANVCQQGPSLP